MLAIGGAVSCSGLIGQQTALPTTLPVESQRSATPTVLGPLDTSDWIRYASRRYGFSLAYPPTGWSAIPGDHDWTLEADMPAFSSSGPDRFETAGPAAGLGIRVSVWSTKVEAATTLDEYIQAFCAAGSATPCTFASDTFEDVATGDGHSGRAWRTGNQTVAFFLDNGTVYVAGIWRPENGPSVQPWGGARRLLTAFLSTMALSAPADGASPAPA